MSNFFDYIEKFKWAILGTILVHIGIFIYLQLKTIPIPYNHKEDVVKSYIEEVPLDNYEINDQTLINNENPINTTNNLNDNRKSSRENFSYNKTDQEVISDIRSYESQINQELHSKHNEDKSDIIQDDKNGIEVNNQKNEIKNASSKNKVSNTTVSYELFGRQEHFLPVPSYKCKGSGIVTIQIKVDRSGKIIEANPIKELSNSATNCMIKQSMKYAKNSRFNYKSNAKNQEGKIIYKFIAQ